jgi:hypothetical protein
MDEPDCVSITFILIQHLIIQQIWLDDILLENDERYFVTIFHQPQTMLPENTYTQYHGS